MNTSVFFAVVWSSPSYLTTCCSKLEWLSGPWFVVGSEESLSWRWFSVDHSQDMIAYAELMSTGFSNSSIAIYFYADGRHGLTCRWGRWPCDCGHSPICCHFCCTWNTSYKAIIYDMCGKVWSCASGYIIVWVHLCIRPSQRCEAAGQVSIEAHWWLSLKAQSDWFLCCSSGSAPLKKKAASCWEGRRDSPASRVSPASHVDSELSLTTPNYYHSGWDLVTIFHSQCWERLTISIRIQDHRELHLPFSHVCVTIPLIHYLLTEQLTAAQKSYGLSTLFKHYQCKLRPSGWES